MPSNAASIDFSHLRKVVLRHSRNVLDPARDYLFETRLGRLIRDHGMSSLRELVDTLLGGMCPELEQRVAEAMTVNETSFFRDGRPFELLRTVVLPPLIEARRASRTLRFWSAGCSTGQEAYSLVMLIRDHFPHLAHWSLRIEGTDIAERVINQARQGRFQRFEMNRGLPARYIPRFFEHQRDEWTIKPELRAGCSFQQLNLCAGKLPFREPFDVIFLRNVLLYFPAEQRRAVLVAAHRLLAHDGALFLGASEQPADPSLWKIELAGGTCCLRRA